MNPGRINTPIVKVVDEWYFHFNGKAVKFIIQMKRPRDPERLDTSGGILKLSTFHAYLDRQYLTDNGMDIKELGFPPTPVSGDDYNDVFERVKTMVWSAKDQAWEKVIAVAVSGVRQRNDEDKVRFLWGVGLRSKDGSLYKSGDSRNYVSRRPCELLPGSISFESEEIMVYPYSEELEASLKELDSMFGKFTGALKYVLSNPDVLLSIKGRMLPALASATEPGVAVVKSEETTSDGVKI